MLRLQTWLQFAFGKKFKNLGNTLEHATQTDGYSCGLIVANTIKHAILGTKLWSHRTSVVDRLEWFIRLANGELEVAPDIVNTNDVSIV